MDIFGFKILMIIISIIELGVSGTIYYCAGNPVLFVIENLLVACCLSGTFTMITPLFNVVFGKELATEIYGLTGFFIGVASFVGPLLAKIMVKDEEDYLMLYLIGGGICLMKFMALICFKENEPYHFKNKNEDVYNDIEKYKVEEIIDSKPGEAIDNNNKNNNNNVINDEGENEENKKVSLI